MTKISIQTLAIYCILFITGNLIAQQPELTKHAVEFSYNYSSVGLNACGTYRHSFSPVSSVIVGLKILDNQPVTDIKGFSFRHRFYAQKFQERLGLVFGLERQFTIAKSNIRPFIGYTAQYTAAHIRGLSAVVDSSYSVLNTDTTWSKYASYRYYYRLHVVHAMENIICAGFTVKAYDRFDLRFSAGIGFSLLLVPENRLYNPRIELTYEPSDYYSIGIIYRLGKPTADQ
ncbi:MAG TPA: hypothetical protein VI731_09905 [Bacteroidia bacterium]|nr:hypothetical protein [Bacteroidia bacterium]